EEKDEAVEHRQLSLVEDRQESASPVGQPVGEGHEAAREERCRAREEPDHHQEPTPELDRSGHPEDERRRTGRRSLGKPEYLLHAVPEEEESRDDAEEGMD